MTDEEKKAIEWVKNNLEETIKLGQKYGLQEAIKEQTIILNLIEKQSKEIEEYKKQLDLDYVKNNYISKDKIKAKIEEIKKYKDLARDSIEERIVIADSDSLNYGRKEAHEKDIEVLQSLLEEKE